jgi:hypothetical protein
VPQMVCAVAVRCGIGLSAIAGETLNPSRSSAPVKLVFSIKGASLEAADLEDLRFSIRLLSGHATGTSK